MDKTMPTHVALLVADDAASDGGRFDSVDRFRALLVLAADSREVRAYRERLAVNALLLCPLSAAQVAEFSGIPRAVLAELAATRRAVTR